MYRDLIKTVKILDRFSINYCITMGAAVSFYTKKRIARDIDIIIKREDLQRSSLVLGTPVLQNKNEFGTQDCILIDNIEISCFDQIEIDNKIYNLSLSDNNYLNASIIFINNYPVKIIAPEILLMHKSVFSKKREKDKKDIMNIVKSGFIDKKLLSALSL